MVALQNQTKIYCLYFLSLLASHWEPVSVRLPIGYMAGKIRCFT